MYKTKKDLYSNIMIALGGRAAEEIVFGKDNITTGASSDLEKATDIALSLVGNLGMDDDFGLINLNVLMSKDIRENKKIVMRTKEILEELYEETIEILIKSRALLDKMSNELIIRETLYENDINRICSSFEAA